MMDDEIEIKYCLKQKKSNVGIGKVQKSRFWLDLWLLRKIRALGGKMI